MLVGIMFAVFAVVAGMPGLAQAGTNPAVEQVTPGNGSKAGGTRVTITGQSFLPDAVVYIGGTPATDVVVVSSTRITATTPQGTVGPAGVMVMNGDGGAATLNGAYYFTEPTLDLTIGTMSATTGPVRGGTLVTITGTGFSGSSVLFGGAPASGVVTQGASMITARTPAGVSGPVTVTVRNADGQSVSLKNAFTYEPGGLEVTSVTPMGGVAAGGTSVRIAGNGFTTGSTVLIGGTPARDVVVVNPTLITATTPAAAAGTVAVSVTTPGSAAGSLANGFTYRALAADPALTLTTVAPSSGSAVGGAQVTLSGTGFSGGAAVYFGGVPGTNVSTPGPSTIFVQTPPNVAGTVPITVVNSDGSSVSLATGYRYEGSSGFAVTSIAPSSGPAAGGTVAVINGSRFVTGAMVAFNGVPATNVWVLGDNQIYATTPPGTGSGVTVSVTNPGGIAAFLPGGFSYATDGSPATPVATPVPTVTTGAVTSGLPLVPRGFGLVVFSGGTNAALVAASGCTAASLTFWSTNASGEFDTYVPGALVSAVNAAWNSRFTSGIPANTPLIGRCQQ